MTDRYCELIRRAIDKFSLDLTDKYVLTEAATGNYVCTSLIAACAGAEVIAFTKDSKYSTIDEVIYQTRLLSEAMNVRKKIRIISSIDETPFEKIDIITNTGHLRPIDERLLSRVRSDTVLPLMYEPWEFREGEIDLEYCKNKGITVCGTDESDPRLRTMDYLGYIVLYFLLKEKETPFSSKVLITGTKKFTDPIKRILDANSYESDIVMPEELDSDFLGSDTLVIADHDDGRLILSGSNTSFLSNKTISKRKLVIQICGNIDFINAKFRHYPNKPASFGYMSYTTDFIDPAAVIDLHTAGLKVAEGLIKWGSEISNRKEYPVLFFNNK